VEGPITLRVAIFDYRTIENSPAGKCHLALLRGLCEEYEFVVFAARFDNPRPDRIGFVRVPVPLRPLALLFLSFHIVAPAVYLIRRMIGLARFDRTQFIESNLLLRDIAYVHFCHRAFLADHWVATRPSGLLRLARWLDHRLHSLIEPLALRRASVIVVPSRGLAGELARYYPFTRPKVRVVANPVDVARFAAKGDFDRLGFRSRLGFSPDDVVLCFAALGAFERKGLPQLVEAMARLAEPTLKLLVVGGNTGTVAAWQGRVKEAGVEGSVVFTGLQTDVRPYLWASDAFAFPTAYEVFPLVGLEAAAAGLPLIVTPVHGLEEFVSDGQNGILIEATAESVARALTRFLCLTPDERKSIGEAAAQAVARYDETGFVGGWRAIYGSAPARNIR
jgi:glycosyltransferase involved in cell wall biosynthesis